MQGFMIYCKANESKDEMIRKLDAATKEASENMEKSIEETDVSSPISLKLSQELDPLIVAKQKILAYGY